MITPEIHFIYDSILNSIYSQFNRHICDQQRRQRFDCGGGGRGRGGEQVISLADLLVLTLPKKLL